jgi:hypothetical protein
MPAVTLALGRVSGLALTLRMTAVLLLLRPQGPPLLHTAYLGVGTVALLAPAALTSAWPWLTAASIVALRVASDWPLADNHVYLLVYWCLALGLALGSATPALTMGRMARWLIALSMAFAVLWKCVLSPDYVDGRFFRMTLIVDERFEDVVRLAGGMSRDEIDGHRVALTPLAPGAQLAEDELLVEPPAFYRLAMALTWGALMWELALAIVFIASLPATVQWIRHALLLAFCTLVYPVAPVAGFGWLLLAMGLSQVPAGEVRWRRAYVVVWLWVLGASELPWAGWMAAALGRA